MTELIAQPLTKIAFAEFGEVIDQQQAKPSLINQGLTRNFNDLFTIDVAPQRGRPIVSLFQTAPLPLPHQVRVMERHPHGSQAFLPLQEAPFLVLVAKSVARLTVADLSLFITTGRQGINLYKNTWHHFQIVLGTTREFIVVDGGGGEQNLEETTVQDEVWIAQTSIAQEIL